LWSRLQPPGKPGGFFAAKYSDKTIIPSVTLALQIAAFFGVRVEEVFNIKEEVK
jgi:hypothetical protein